MDPDEVESLLARLAWLPARLGAAFARLEGGEPPIPLPVGEWGPRQVLAHVRASGEILAPRIFHVLVRDNPLLPAYDQDRWALVAGYESLPAAELLETLRLQRVELVHALRALPPADWHRTGTHEARGPLTVLQLATALADHEEEHCIQLEHMAEVGHG